MAGEESIFDFSDVPLAHEDLPRRAAPTSGGLLKSTQEFSDVTLAFDESAFEYFGVTLARKEDFLGVLPDPDRRCESHFIILTIENIFI